MPGTVRAPGDTAGSRNNLAGAVATLNPGSFALVMATGIVSVGMYHHGLLALSAALLWIGAFCYVVLAVLTVARIAFFPDRLRADLGDAGRAFGFYTTIAGTEVLGVGYALHSHRGAALGLLAAGTAGWLVLGYLVPWTAVLGRAQRPVLATANGTWFIWVVASQSVAALAAALEPSFRGASAGLGLLAVSAFFVGVFLYAAAGVFVAARLLVYPLRPIDLEPPYWVAMGATAITVVAGARIVAMADTPMVNATRGLIAGAAVGFWVFGSWLIPALVAAGWWRHVTHRVPLRYQATLWSVVFPLGMYGVAGHYLGEADHLPIVRAIGENETWVALAAWALTFAAMLMHLSRILASPDRRRAG